jgi:hypothetical protein
MTAGLPLQGAYEFCAGVAISALTGYVVGRNPNVPNRNHLIIASIASICVTRVLEFLAGHLAKSIHRKLGQNVGSQGFLKSAISIPSSILGNFILVRFTPLQLPHFVTTCGYLSINNAVKFTVLNLGYYLIPEFGT